MSWADQGGDGTPAAGWSVGAGGPGSGLATASGSGYEPGRLAAGARRQITAPPTVTRQNLLRTLRELSFESKVEQLSLLEAVRGSRLGGVTLTAARLPVMLRIGLEATDSGTQVTVLLVDRWPGRVGRNWGATAAYVDLFGGVLGAVDAVLARLDPKAAASFPGWWRQTGPGDVAVMQNAASLAAQASSALSRHAGRLLDGGASTGQRQATVSRAAGSGTFVFEAPDAVAEVPAELADAMLMVGALIVERPGGMPASLVSQVQSLVFRVEEHLAGGAGAGGRPPAGPGGPGGPGGGRYRVEPADVPVVTFLHQQARLRDLLPARTLRTCTTCRLEKVTNPELERLQERTRRTRELATGLSAVVTPYVLAGRLAQLNNKAPKFACPRCQGMDADETVVTYCQRCGDRRSETALRACGKCQFDFRGMLRGEQPWRERGLPDSPAPPALSAPSAPAPPTRSAPPPAPTRVDPDDARTWPRPPG